MNILAKLRALSGLNLSRTEVERAIAQRMASNDITDRKAYGQALTEVELEALLELVVVPESWLFRDAQAFVVATAFAQQRLAAGVHPVRILSVPCAGGEEPYSMAMALCDAGVAPSDFLIEAIDISAACVARAEQGIYGRNAFRSAELTFRDRYFTALDAHTYQVQEALRQCVQFRRANLLQEQLAPATPYDIIFCRNLLIYFDKPTTQLAIERLAAMLHDDGILLAGYAEVPSFTQQGFTPLPQRQSFGLRKKGPAPAPETPTGPTAAPPSPKAAARRPPAAASPPPAPIKTRSTPPPPAAAATDHADLLAQARRLADLGQQAEAAAACRALLAQRPDSADAYFILGLLAEIGRQGTEAEAQLKRCLYLQPDHYEALCHLALLHEQNGNRSAAATLKARAARVYQRQHAH
jgi:chemotaxis protein methyltransferase WspC